MKLINKLFFGNVFFSTAKAVVPTGPENDEEQSPHPLQAFFPSAAEEQEKARRLERQKDFLLYESFLPDRREERVPHGFYKRKTPILHWDVPTVLTYPEPLSSQHLQAYCSDIRGRLVPGKFFFFPTEGAMWQAGWQEVELTFIPDQPQKFSTLQVKKDFEVRKRRPQVSWGSEDILELIFLTALPASIFEEVRCELSEGQFDFSHQPGEVLAVGIHRLCVEYTPSVKESVNYSRGYASRKISIITTRVPLRWILPPQAATELFYPLPLPAWLFCAECLWSQAEGVFVYSPSQDSILCAGQHTLSATFQPRDSLSYHPTTIQISVTVHPAPTVVLWSQPVPLPAGDPLGPATLCASNSQGLNGSYCYTPAAGTILEEGEHSLSVLFTPQDNNYAPSTGFVRLRVTRKRALKLQWFLPEPARYPCPLSRQQLNACLVGFGSHAEGDYEYDPPLGTVLPVGQHTLSATFRPVRQSFLPAQISVSFEVLPCIVRLLWRTPDPLLHGEGLFDSVLNAQLSYPTIEDISGSFLYNPPVGTVLPPGQHRLSVRFIPSDSHNYLEASASVTIIIRERPKYRARLLWPLLLHIRRQQKEKEQDAEVEAEYSKNEEPLEGEKRSLEAARAAAKLRARLLLLSGEDQEEELAEGGDPSTVSKEIIYGDPLSDDILSVSCTNAQGRILYDPDLGELGQPLLLPVGEHVLTARFEPDEALSPLALPSSLATRIRIIPRRPFLDWRLADRGEKEAGRLVYGEPLDRDYRRAVAVFAERDKRPIPGNYFYHPPIGTILEAGPHNLTIRFEPSDGVNYAIIEAVKEIFVERAVPAIEWFGPEKPIFYPYATVTMSSQEEQGENRGGALLSKPRAINPELPGEGSLAGTWSFSFPLDCPLPAGRHELSCRFYPEDLINYFGNSATINVVVLPAVPRIVWSPEEVLIYETPLSSALHCCATSEVPGVFKYDPPAGTVLSASGKALVHLTFIPQDGDNYQTVSLVKRLEVRPREAVVAWPLPRRLPYGTVVTPLLLCAHLSPLENTALTLSALQGATFHYAPGVGEVPKAGFRVRFAVRMQPPDNQRRDYASVDKIVEVEIYRVSPPVSWKPPVTHLFEGEPLNERHLCAQLGHRPAENSRGPLGKSNAKRKAMELERQRLSLLFPGTFHYQPPLGSILAPGRHAVRMTFQPAEPENALPVSQTINFDVSRRGPRITWQVDPLTGKTSCVKVSEGSTSSSRSITRAPHSDTGDDNNSSSLCSGLNEASSILESD